MVRDYQPPLQGIDALEQMEKDTDDQVSAIYKQRREDFKTELDTGFYFSVVFDTRKERDEWLQNHGVKLTEDFFVKAGDFNL